MNDSSEVKPYEVKLFVGKDILGDAKQESRRVETLVNRQLLCDMTADIEFNIWQLNQENNRIKSSNRIHDGLQYRNLNYMITGMRGSGKTTFLHYLIQCLTGKMDPFDEKSTEHGERNRYSARFYLGESRKSVQCKLLHRFDPSTPRFGKSSFLISVVAAIQSVLEQVSENVKECSDERDVQLMECNSVLKALDKGIACLSRDKDALSELSEYEVAHLRAESAELEEQIRENFHRVLELLCRLCRVDAFIVSIDDADTHFGQCACVLENLRLYMTCPHLVVLMACDRDLYLERIRELHFSEFSLDYHRIDKQGENYRLEYVMNHASQYMIKLFPLENHYELRDLHFLAHKNDPISCTLYADLNLEGKEKQARCELFTFIRAVFQVAINSQDPCIENFVRLFLRMPLRSVLQVINAWTLDDVWKGLIQNGKLSENGQLKAVTFSAAPNVGLRKLRMQVKKSVFIVLQNEIRFADYNCAKTDFEHPRDFYLLMQVLCHRLNDAERGYFLTGASGNKLSDQYVALLLALSAHYHLRDFGSLLAYFMYGPASVALYAKALKQYHRRRKEASDPRSLKKFEEDFSRYLHVGSWESPSRWARHANMIWASDTGKEAMHLGILRLRYTYLMQKLKKRLFYFEARQQNQKSQTMERGTDAEKSRLLKSVALYVSMSYSEERDNSYFISVFNYIAFVLRCYQYCKQIKEHYAVVQNEQSRQDEWPYKSGLEELIKDNLLVKSCLNPEWLIEKRAEINENNEKPEYVFIDKTEYEKYKGGFEGEVCITDNVLQQRHPSADNIAKVSLKVVASVSTKLAKPMEKDTQELVKTLSEKAAARQKGIAAVKKAERVRMKWLKAESEVFRGMYGDLLAALAQAIWKWYCDAEDQMKNSEDDVSPQKLASFWAAAYYHLKQANYSVGQLKLDAVEDADELKKLGTLIELVATEIARMFSMAEVPKDFVLIEDKEIRSAGMVSPPAEPSNSPYRTATMRSLLGSFPLSAAFIAALNDFADCLKTDDIEKEIPFLSPAQS